VLVLDVEKFAAGQGHSNSGNHGSRSALVKHRMSAPYCLHLLSSTCSSTMNIPDYQLTKLHPPSTFHITPTLTPPTNKPPPLPPLTPNAFPPCPKAQPSPIQLTPPSPIHRLPRLQLALQTPALQPPRPRRSRALQLGRRVCTEMGRGCRCL
jgi:hypothetical protein